MIKVTIPTTSPLFEQPPLPRNEVLKFTPDGYAWMLEHVGTWGDNWGYGLITKEQTIEFEFWDSDPKVVMLFKLTWGGR